MTHKFARSGVVAAVAALVCAAAGIADPASAAVTYSYSNGAPNVSFKFTADTYITSYVVKTYAELAPTGTTLFDAAEFCPAGTLCGRFDSFHFTENFDIVFLYNLREATQLPPATVTDPVTGLPVLLPPTTVSQESRYVPGTFVTPGKYSSSTSGATLTISDSTVSAVPEPATWGMMILGVGAVGYAMRRRPRSTARISYAVR